MKAMNLVTVSVVALSFVLTGCMTAGMHMSSNVTNVELSSPNYKVIARSVQGEAKSGHILGASFGVGAYTQIMSVARISGDKALYQAAMDNLWASFESKYGKVEGRRLALVNIRYDVDALNLIIYTQPKLTIQADVVEFGE